MQVKFTSIIQQNDNYQSNQTFQQSEKIASDTIDAFPINSIDKKLYQLAHGNTFSKDILSDITDTTKISFIHVDIYDVSNDPFNNNVWTFDLNIGGIDYGQISHFDLLNLISGFPTSTPITISTITLPNDGTTVNLAVLIGLKS